jgi:hypothetical protein
MVSQHNRGSEGQMMLNSPGRAFVVAAIGGAILIAGALPAVAAANPGASCVGTVASTLAAHGGLNVNDVFKPLAEALGSRNFGEFVQGGARRHVGDVQQCIYPPAP